MADQSHEFALEKLLGDFGPTPLEDTPYFAAVGRFIVAYANAEAVLHLTTRLLSSMPEDKARIIFAGMRLTDLAARLRPILLLEGNKSPRYKEVDACLTQLDIIATERNKLVHRMVSYSEKTIRASKIC
jgi:hypothetical protein